MAVCFRSQDARKWEILKALSAALNRLKANEATRRIPVFKLDELGLLLSKLYALSVGPLPAKRRDGSCVCRRLFD